MNTYITMMNSLVHSLALAFSYSFLRSLRLVLTNFKVFGSINYTNRRTAYFPDVLLYSTEFLTPSKMYIYMHYSWPMKNVPTLKLLMVERVTQKRCTNFNLYSSPSPRHVCRCYTSLQNTSINKFLKPIPRSHDENTLLVLLYFLIEFFQHHSSGM